MTESKTGQWDASAYHELSTPMVALGQLVLARLAVEGHETALDAGCGTGRLTAALLDRLAHGHVVGIDPSESMLTVASQFLTPRFGRRVTLVRADAAHLPFQNVFDLIFSTATFHWITDQPLLFRSLFVALKPGGRLEAQCGGVGNLQRMLERAGIVMREPRFAPYFQGWVDCWEFADAETTARRLSQAGFVDTDTTVQPVPVTLPDASTFKNYISTIIVRPHLQRLPPEPGDAFLDALAAQAAADDPPFLLDYCRLNLRGRKP